LYGIEKTLVHIDNFVFATNLRKKFGLYNTTPFFVKKTGGKRTKWMPSLHFLKKISRKLQNPQFVSKARFIAKCLHGKKR